MLWKWLPWIRKSEQERQSTTGVVILNPEKKESWMKIAESRTSIELLELPEKEERAIWREATEKCR